LIRITNKKLRLTFLLKETPSARKMVRKDIIASSKQIVFVEYRRIATRDYKVLHKE